ncbi:MAG: hypothetical protein Q4D06_05130, partial [Coriobacteriia bacterium]|nr:hypothetical protein [Coriobacteriia bacterium]
MRVFIGGDTARSLNRWAADRLEPTEVAGPKPDERPSAVGVSLAWDAIRRTGLSHARLNTLKEHPLDLLVADSRARLRLKGVTCSSQAAPLPAGWFRRLPGDSEHDVLVAGPELCFLQAAATKPLYDAILFGMEICGLYAEDDLTAAGFTSRDEPLTTPVLIHAFLDASPGVRGLRAARRALRYVASMSASPMES